MDIILLLILLDIISRGRGGGVGVVVVKMAMMKTNHKWFNLIINGVIMGFVTVTWWIKEWKTTK